MFGKREIIEKHFPDFRIDLLEIPGTSYIDAESRYTFRLDEFENLWEYYFECFARLKNKVDVKFVLSSEGFGQELSSGLIAIREALVNMLMHADYFSASKSRIRIFTNHIEFYNPGGLPKDLETLKKKDISLPRNPILAKLFRMVRLSENAGFGFDKIEHNWNDYNGTKPGYQIDFDSVIVDFMVKPKTDQKTDQKTMIMKLMTNKPKISIAEIANEINKGLTVTKSRISELKKENKIQRIGPDKGGYWKIIKTFQK